MEKKNDENFNGSRVMGKICSKNYFRDAARHFKAKFSKKTDSIGE